MIREQMIDRAVRAVKDRMPNRFKLIAAHPNRDGGFNLQILVDAVRKELNA